MKKFILLLILAAHAQAGWFGPSKEEKELVQCQQELKESRQRLDRQRHETGGWEIATGVAAIGAVILFVVGAALGSKVRRQAKRGGVAS